MKICFYTMFHIGDIYMMSFFIKIICELNKDKQFFYYTINGDIFFENIDNIKRINDVKQNYSEKLINGNPPENLVNNDILQILINNNMWGEGARIIKIDNEDVLFINTWCKSNYLNDDDFNIITSMHSYPNLIQQINTHHNLNIHFKLECPKELLKDLSYNLFLEKYSNIDLCDTTFIFNYVTRSLNTDMNVLNNYIIELSKTNKIILACHDSLFENNQNIKFIDKDYNIVPDPSCSNLIEIWEIAIKCNKIIILPTGSSWTFFHKLNNIKENQIFFYGISYVDKLNNNINALLGENKNFIKTL